ncbi:MAG TPA: DUF2127 domain-containing protein [Gemmatimonadaceae bacterium]|nr:DUF2127 domain-containing protein [Gemmatimonadaceae bacterium]
MVAKAVDGVLELGGGLALFALSPRALNAIVLFFIQGELREDPRDFLANLFLHASHGVVRIRLFAGILLVAHGAIKLGLVGAVVRRRLWAYPTAIVIFSGFVVYQLYQIAVGPSVFLWLVTVVDIAVIALIAHEYRWILGRPTETHHPEGQGIDSTLNPP